MLAVHDLVAGYAGNTVLHGISLQVAKGEIVALVGANGAGKSTLARTISGLLRPLRGTIELEGRPIGGMPAHRVVATGVSLVPEGRMVFPRLTVQQNLLLGAFTQRDPALVEQSLAEVFQIFPRLRERLGQLAGSMSGGEQQMLAIGRALMSRPKLLILDEPSMGVMPKLVAEILALVRRIAEAGTTILLVEQNVREALELAHRAYVLQTGRIVQAGTGAELLDSELVQKAYLGL